MPPRTLGHLFLSRVTAPCDGVAEIAVTADAQVAEDAMMMVITPVNDPSP